MQHEVPKRFGRTRSFPGLTSYLSITRLNRDDRKTKTTISPVATLAKHKHECRTAHICLETRDSTLTWSSDGSTDPNQDSWKIGLLSWGWLTEPSPYPPLEEVSIVKSQYGSVSLGFTACRLASNVLDTTEWLVRKPRPSWNCVIVVVVVVVNTEEQARTERQGRKPRGKNSRQRSKHQLARREVNQRARMWRSEAAVWGHFEQHLSSFHEHGETTRKSVYDSSNWSDVFRFQSLQPDLVQGTVNTQDFVILLLSHDRSSIYAVPYCVYCAAHSSRGYEYESNATSI